MNKNDSVAKTENEKKIAQKAPSKPSVKPEKPVEKQPDVKKPDVMTTKDQNNKPDPGKKTAQTKQVVKQGTEPVTKPTNQIAAPVPAKSTSSKVPSATGPSSFATTPSKAIGHVEVYKSADFSSSVSSDALTTSTSLYFSSCKIL